MAEYILTNKAFADLNEIWQYTLEHWSENQADKYYKMLLDSCQDIADNPGLGRTMTVLNPNFSSKSKPVYNIL